MNDRPKKSSRTVVTDEGRAKTAASESRAAAQLRDWRSDPGFETRAIHAGTPPDPTTGARITPIFQTTAYVFDDADHAASLFDLSTSGCFYSRLTNPTLS